LYQQRVKVNDILRNDDSHNSEMKGSRSPSLYSDFIGRPAASLASVIDRQLPGFAEFSQ